MGNGDPDWPSGLLGDEVYYEITSACDLHCSHCCGVFRNGHSHVDPERLIGFHNDWMLPRIRHAVITGGEPTLHPAFARILEGVSATVPTTVTTNGVRCDPNDWIALLDRLPNVFIQISVDGATATTFDAVRGSGVQRRVDTLLTRLADHGLGHRVALSMTVTKQNAMEVADVIAYAERLGLGHIHFPQFLSVGSANAASSSLELSPEEQIGIEENLLRLGADPRSRLGISVNRLDRASVAVGTGIADCLSPCTLKIDSTGAILPCPVSRGSALALGSIHDSCSPIPGVTARLLQLDRSAGELTAFTFVAADDGSTHSVRLRLCEACCLSGCDTPQGTCNAARIIEHHVRSAMAALSEIEHASEPIVSGGDEQ